ncbi:MAG TPA: hypothetical protein DCK98_05415 [Chloroflexi bacterium]|jgi:tetratricopeptide (TPR) repeat protein|nr:hypothetical protein [Chloroflexota bacterium]HAL25976.1 hypothetical protein [Chloroflexota bacterium]
MSARHELGTLEASGLVQVAALEPELEYLFRHALVQDAAYSSLLKQDRRTLHRLAADTLLTLYPERQRELAAVIALHLERAGDPAAAAEHLVIAGEHALERFANRESLAFFDRAAASLADDDPRIDLRLRAALGAARVSWTFGSIDGPTERLGRALASGEERADPKLVGDAYFWIAFLRRMRGERPETSPTLKHAAERAAEIGRARGDPLADAFPNAFAGVGMMSTGQLRQGANVLAEALPPILAHGDPLSSAILSGLLSVTYSRLGEFAEAERSLAHAERLAQNGDPIAALDTQIARSSLLIERGDVAEGEALASTCAARSEELGALACSVASNVMAGIGHLARDDALGAKVPLERGDELAQVSNMESFRTLAQGMLGSVRTQLGDVPGGVAAWTLALERSHAMHDRSGEAMTLWQRARTRARATPPNHAAALADIDAATKLLEEMEARPSLARSLRDRAQILRALGRAADADVADQRSRAIGVELGLKDFAP